MTGKTIVFLSILLAAMTPVAAAGEGAQALSRSAIFKATLHEVGGMRGNYFGPGWYVIDQLMKGQSGPPDKTVTLPDGNFMVSGCRFHSCDEKSAIILTAEPKMLAAGLINFHCRLDRTKPRGHRIHPPTTCDDVDHPPTLTIFVKKKNERPELTQPLKDWAVRVSRVQTVEIRYIP
jgi:hypothetical protein